MCLIIILIIIIIKRKISDIFEVGNCLEKHYILFLIFVFYCVTFSDTIQYFLHYICNNLWMWAQQEISLFLKLHSFDELIFIIYCTKLFIKKRKSKPDTKSFLVYLCELYYFWYKVIYFELGQVHSGFNSIIFLTTSRFLRSSSLYFSIFASRSTPCKKKN